MKFEKDYRRIFIYSDAHIDGTDPKKENAAYMIMNDRLRWSDVAIDAGDFWERHSLSYERLAQTPIGGLFPIMRDKVIKLFGNHDKKENYSDIPPFWLQSGHEYSFQSGGTPFLVLHGDKFDSASYIDQLMSYRLVRGLMPQIKKIERYLLGQGAKTTGRLAKYYQQWNEEQKAGFVVARRRLGEWGIAGHTHKAEIDSTKRYANAGEFPFTFLQIEKGEVKLCRV